MEIAFARPIYLWAMLIIPVLVFLYFISVKYSKAMTLKFANFIALSRISGGIGEVSNVTILVVRMLALTLIIFSISGLTIWYVGETFSKDYVLAIDSSASMMAEDFSPNRLEAAKQAAIIFVDNLPVNSYVGVLSFSGVSFLNLPLTLEKDLVKEAISDIQSADIGGTDVGNAIITGTNILLPSKKAKSIILLTDGRSNIGVSEETAIRYALDNHIIVDTIGIGTIQSENKLDLGVDEKALKRISTFTLGNNYLVTNTEELNMVYDTLLKTKQIGKNPLELSFPLLLIALVLLLSDWLLGNTLYRRIP